MLRRMPLGTLALVALSSIFIGSCMAEAPTAIRLDGVPKVQQLTNYCGPACVAAVMQFHGSKTGQAEIGKAIYRPSLGATTGADMLYYSRNAGYAAYSWNSSIEDVKKKLAAGCPVIVLEQNSESDTSGHYRVLTGYSDLAEKFFVMDPYYNITEMSYKQTDKFWRRMGFWALVIVPTDKDKFAAEMQTNNAVLHMDLSYAKYMRRDYTNALSEARRALDIDPRNAFALSLESQIRSAMGAGHAQSRR